MKWGALDGMGPCLGTSEVPLWRGLRLACHGRSYQGKQTIKGKEGLRVVGLCLAG
jgi:hypothetical protein